MATSTRGGITRRQVLQAGGATFAGCAVGVDTALAQANKSAELVIYPGVGHGFFADHRPSYNAAADAWKRGTGLLDKTLKA